MAFLAWVFVSTDPHERLNRACQPVDWLGNIVISFEAFVYPEAQEGTKRFFDRTEYMCEYSLWRLVYEKEWKAYQETLSQKVSPPESQSNPINGDK